MNIVFHIHSGLLFMVMNKNVKLMQSDILLLFKLIGQLLIIQLMKQFVTLLKKMNIISIDLDQEKLNIHKHLILESVFLILILMNLLIYLFKIIILHQVLKIHTLLHLLELLEVLM
mmetsp:Transcript_2211/g.6025  ORF Transcript_2211/g.6025 Transcript_2211/m.6025 type:complete len:116 (+) Transcript_2211:727-1074(+)